MWSWAALAAGLAALSGAGAGHAAHDAWQPFVGQWRTDTRPAYSDSFHFELSIWREGDGLRMLWEQRFASFPVREIRRATLRPNALGDWAYAATSPIGRTRQGTVRGGDGVLVFEYREHDPSGRTARIRETFTLDGARFVAERMIWRAGGWQPLTSTVWTLSAKY